jgi:uncharacterized protein (DUF697 family)
MIKSILRDTLNKFETVSSNLEESVNIAIFYSREDVAIALGKLIKKDAGEKPPVRLIDLNSLQIEDLEKNGAHDLLIFVFEAGFDRPEKVRPFTRRLEFLERNFASVIWGASVESDIETSLINVIAATGKSADEISVTNIDLMLNLDEFAEKCLTTVEPSKKLPLGYNFPFFRPCCADSVVKSAAKQNGLASMGLFFSPAAGMTVLTANQIKMVLELAALYKQDLGIKRAKEVLATLGIGYTARGIAKTFLQILPLPAVPVKGAIAYSITLGLGKAAIEYFKNGHLG